MLAFDTETHLIEPGVLAPKLVCMQLGDGKHESIVMAKDAKAARIAALEVLHANPLVMHNGPFDAVVMIREYPRDLKAWFDKYDRGEVIDTKLRAQLHAIAEGVFKRQKFGLGDLCESLLKRPSHKNPWRLRFKELENTPVCEWPREAREYADEDVKATYEIAALLPPCPTEVAENQAALALHLSACWGIWTSREKTDALEASLQHRYAVAKEECQAMGLVRDSGSKNMQAVRDLVEAELDAERVDAMRTPTGQVCIDRKVLRLVPGAEPYRRMLLAEKMLSTYVPMLRLGHDTPINVGWRLQETGRWGCFKPGLNQIPRGGGVRTCFVPREGRVFVSADYATAELRALAQIHLDMFGTSTLADLIREGIDLHCWLAARLPFAEGTPDEIKRRVADGDPKAKFWRTAAKSANFAFWGGLGPAGFVSYTAGLGLEIDLPTARVVRGTWRDAMIEAPAYFAWANVTTRSEQVTQPRTGMVRGEPTYCQTCNQPFQGLVAAGAKRALWEVTKACYTNPGSALYGARVAHFWHDEIILEVPKDRAKAGAEELGKLMREAMDHFTPDVPSAVDAHVHESGCWEEKG